MGSKDRRVHWGVDRMSCGMRTAQIRLIICFQIELDKFNIYETLTCSITKMCWFICIRFYTASSRCLSLSSVVAVSVARELRVNEEVLVLVHRRI
jgi:hypothetical protein